MLASSPTLFKNVFTWKQSENVNRSRWQMTLPLLQWNSEWVPLPLIHRTGKRWHGATKDIPTNPFTSVLEWVYSLHAAKWLQSCLTLWTVARQAFLSMGFSRQEYWSGLQCPPPVDLPDPGIEPMSHTSPAMKCGFLTTTATSKDLLNLGISYKWNQTVFVLSLLAYFT